MREMRQDRIALDRASVSARTFDDGSGHMHVAQTNISKAAVNPYNGDEIPGWEELGLNPDKVYKLFRHPEELQNAASTFNGKPLVMVHRAQSANDSDDSNRVGSVSNATYEHPFLKADLAVWSKRAIDAIESGAQRELSCGYHYTPDMTPGEYEGEKYDGVMRSLGGNHVALVEEGRAGKDCHVFDSMEKLLMSKNALQSRAAIAGPIALAALLKPKMAKDAKVDWAPLFKGVTAKNFGSKKAGMAADMKRQLTGKLAKDADMSDVVELLDALEDVIPEAGPDVEFKKIDDMPNAGADLDDPVEDEDDDAELKKALKDLGILDDDIAKVCARVRGASAQDDAPANKGTDPDLGAVGVHETDGGGSTRTYAPSTGGSEVDVGAADEGDDDKKDKDKKAMDARFKEAMKGMVSKQAMDQAIAANEAKTIARLNAIAEAREHVAPWVGRLPQAFDSAEQVYRTALASREITDTDDLPLKAMKMVLDRLPKPGEERRPANRLAQDAAAASGFAERYPAAAGIRLL